MHLRRPAYLIIGITVTSIGHARAAEFYVGGPETKNSLEIVGNYLTGIEMEPMPKGSAMGPDAVHLELDIHAPKTRRMASARTPGFLISPSPTPSRRSAPN